MPNPMDVLMRTIARNAGKRNQRVNAWEALMPGLRSDRVRDYDDMGYEDLQRAICSKNRNDIPAAEKMTVGNWAAFYGQVIEANMLLLDGIEKTMEDCCSYEGFVEDLADAFGEYRGDNASVGVFKTVANTQRAEWCKLPAIHGSRSKSLLVYMLLCCTLGPSARRLIDYNDALTRLGLPVVDIETDPLPEAAAPEHRSAGARWRVSMTYEAPGRSGRRFIEEAFVPAAGGSLAVGRGVTGDNALLVPGKDAAVGGGFMSREHFVLKTSKNRKTIRLEMPDRPDINSIWVYPRTAEAFEMKGGYAYLGSGWQFSVQPPEEGRPSASKYPVFSVEMEFAEMEEPGFKGGDETDG